MKKYLILFVISAFFACSGGGNKQAALTDSLKNANANITSELKVKENLLNSKEAAMAEFITSFNEIEKNLNEIKDKEKIISTSSNGKEFNKSKKDQIIADIQIIYDLLDKNKQKMASLNKKLKSSNLKIDELDVAVNNLTYQSNE